MEGPVESGEFYSHMTPPFIISVRRRRELLRGRWRAQSFISPDPNIHYFSKEKEGVVEGPVESAEFYFHQTSIFIISVRRRRELLRGRWRARSFIFT